MPLPPRAILRRLVFWILGPTAQGQHSSNRKISSRIRSAVRYERVTVSVPYIRGMAYLQKRNFPCSPLLLFDRALPRACRL